MMRPTTDCSLQFEESRAAIIVRFQQTLEYNIYMNETCCRASGISCIRFLYVMFWLKRWKGFIKVANINAAFHFWVYIFFKLNGLLFSHCSRSRPYRPRPARGGPPLDRTARAPLPARAASARRRRTPPHPARGRRGGRSRHWACGSAAPRGRGWSSTAAAAASPAPGAPSSTASQ